MKKVLIMCTGNSCRSIIAEALINDKLDGIVAYSSGVSPSKKVNPNAKNVLQKYGIWRDDYHSKSIDTLANIEFDLLVTVCDHAHENCPLFEREIPKIHIGFTDPDGKKFDEFIATYHNINDTLLPKISEFFNQKNIIKNMCYA